MAHQRNRATLGSKPRRAKVGRGAAPQSNGQSGTAERLPDIESHSQTAPNDGAEIGLKREGQLAVDLLRLDNEAAASKRQHEFRMAALKTAADVLDRILAPLLFLILLVVLLIAFSLWQSGRLVTAGLAALSTLGGFLMPKAWGLTRGGYRRFVSKHAAAADLS